MPGPRGPQGALGEPGKQVSGETPGRGPWLWGSGPFCPSASLSNSFTLWCHLGPPVLGRTLSP